MFGKLRITALLTFCLACVYCGAFASAEGERWQICSRILAQTVARVYDRFSPPKVAFEETVSNQDLESHMSLHLGVYPLGNFGVPIYDIQVAASRGFRLDGFASEVLQKLQASDEDIHQELYQGGSIPRLYRHAIRIETPEHYRTILIKTLRYLDLTETAAVDWKQVEEIVPGASAISFNPWDDPDYTDTHYKGYIGD